MDQYLLIPFLEGWTSINPSYFDVNILGVQGNLTHCQWTSHFFVKKQDLSPEKNSKQDLSRAATVSKQAAWDPLGARLGGWIIPGSARRLSRFMPGFCFRTLW